jgi:hypothetical protein
VDSLEIHLNASELTIAELFDSVFKNTQYSIQPGTGKSGLCNKAIHDSIGSSEKFFNTNITDTAQSTLLAEESAIQKISVKISPENKLYEVGTKNGTKPPLSVLQWQATSEMPETEKQSWASTLPWIHFPLQEPPISLDIIA